MTFCTPNPARQIQEHPPTKYPSDFLDLDFDRMVIPFFLVYTKVRDAYVLLSNIDMCYAKYGF